jgi:hypothetical protein
MALVNGPLFSLDAGGAIGKAIVYSKWKGRNLVRKFVVPANPSSLAQKAVRTIIAAANILWDIASPTDKASWDADAASRNISPFNQLTSVALDRFQNGEWPTNNVAEPGTTPTTDATGATLTVRGRSVHIEFTGLTDTDESAMLLVGIRPGSATTLLPPSTLAAAIPLSPSQTSAEVTIDKLEPGDYGYGMNFVDQYGNALFDGFNWGENFTIT